jgi:signal transduction histidine kinase
MVAESGEPFWTDHLADEPLLQRPGLVQAGFHTLVCVPLAAHGSVLGVMTLGFLAARTMRDREMRLLSAIGGGVGIVVENGRLLRQARRLAVLEERERIGMDLHDGIIQSIYAVGLTLDSARLLAKPKERKESDAALERAIAGMNAIIRDIRAYILDLQPSRIPTEDLAVALRRLLEEFKANSLMEADLILEPGAAEALPTHLRGEAFLIVQEAIANVGKHSHANHAWVSLRRIDQRPTLQILDNGQGFDGAKEASLLGHGLSNMAARAHAAGAEMDIVSNPGEGTSITVRFPADHESPAGAA